MAKSRRSHPSLPGSAEPNAVGKSTDFRQALDHGMAEAARVGDWERWLGSALETGDPQFWPQLRHLYQQHPEWRWNILFHLRIYWGDYEPMVAPVFREALRGPDQCAVAFEAMEVFPALAEEAIAALQDSECLRRVSRMALPQAITCLKQHPDRAVNLLRKLLREPACSQDPDCAEGALAMAAVFPALADDVVACLKDPEFVRRVGPDPLLGCLACQFGLTDGPADLIHTEWGWADALLEGVRAELKRRYGLG
jgi:hypothetical protein